MLSANQFFKSLDVKTRQERVDLHQQGFDAKLTVPIDVRFGRHKLAYLISIYFPFSFSHSTAILKEKTLLKKQCSFVFLTSWGDYDFLRRQIDNKIDQKTAITKITFFYFSAFSLLSLECSFSNEVKNHLTLKAESKIKNIVKNSNQQLPQPVCSLESSGRAFK